MSRQAVYDGTGLPAGPLRPSQTSEVATPAPGTDKPGDGDTAPESGVQRPAESDRKADWVAYADTIGVTVGSDATKAQIIEAVQQAEDDPSV